MNIRSNIKKFFFAKNLTFLILFSPALFAFNKVYDHENFVDQLMFIQDTTENLKIDSTMSDGTTPLILFAELGVIDGVDLFLTEGSDPNQLNNFGETALMAATKNGHIAVVERLLKEKNIDVNKLAVDEATTALGIAYLIRHYEIADLLIKHGAIAGQGQILIIANTVWYIYDMITNNSYKEFAEKFKVDGFDLVPEPFLMKMKMKKDKIGMCHGLTSLWLYSRWLDTHPEIDSKYNSHWFNNIVKDISKWDGKQKPEHDELNFAMFITLMDLLQNNKNQFDFEGSFASSKLNTQGKTLKRKYSIASKFTLEQLQQLLSEIVHDNELIMVRFAINGKSATGHIVGLFKNENYYYYYDPNKFWGEIKEISVNKIAEIIFVANKFYNQDKNPSLVFIVSSFDDTPHDYPDPKNYLSDIKSPTDNNDLIAAISANCMCCFKYFLNETINPNEAIDETGITPLLTASEYGNTAMVKMLLEKGVNVNKPTVDGLTPISSASPLGYTDIIESLLNNGADPNSADVNGVTPLMKAASKGHTKIAQILLKHGAKLTTKNLDDWNAIKYATVEGHLEILKSLLDYGSDKHDRAELVGDNIRIANIHDNKDCEIFLEEYLRGEHIY